MLGAPIPRFFFPKSAKNCIKKKNLDFKNKEILISYVKTLKPI